MCISIKRPSFPSTGACKRKRNPHATLAAVPPGDDMDDVNAAHVGTVERGVFAGEGSKSMNTAPEEYEPPNAARLIALRRQQWTLELDLASPGKPGNNGEAQEQRKLSQRLDRIQAEIVHLEAIVRGMPVEVRHVDAADTELRAAIQKNTGAVVAIPPDAEEQTAARNFADCDLATLRDIGDDGERFAALLAMGSSAANRTAYKIELQRQAPEVEREAAEAFAAALEAHNRKQAFITANTAIPLWPDVDINDPADLALPSV